MEASYLEFHGCLDGNHVLPKPVFSGCCLSALKRIFRFDQQAFAKAVAQTQAEPPNILRINWTEEILPQSAMAWNGIALLREDLAEARRAIQLFRQVLDPFDRVVKHVARVIRDRVVVVISNIAAERLQVPTRPAHSDVAFDQVRVERRGL